MKCGTWWDEVREANAFSAPDKPRFEPLMHLCRVSTALCSFLAARGHCSTLPRCSSRSDGTEKNRPSAPQTNTITVLHNMQGVLKRLTPLSKRSIQNWTVEQSGLDRGQTVWLKQTELRKSNMTRSLSGRYTVRLHSTPHLNTFSCPRVWGLFSALISVC